ncbi:40S ribosomal protein eS21 [Drepanopeziza brunnea f. sp. 'multigermtubi']|uniref:40S ribosomal protein eS21 n=1 Tax=Drepanopeziza brunnea f. sp. 'multigermtubi' TaxID=698441 RepID=UPI0023A22645|nr:hypothetical protein L3040_007484 [Drepanopeziza brunnea f. sp. 'multigermtubi']
MENDKGELVDLYVPRKCSATNRIIKAKDHASVQISIGKVDENGRFTGESQVYALCGFTVYRGYMICDFGMTWAGIGNDHRGGKEWASGGC